MNKYRYFNITLAQYETVFCDVEPTECINNTHSFDSASLTVLQIDVKVNDGTTVHQQTTLEGYKELRYNEINAKTAQLISTGFVFDSQTFSTSYNAQLNWSEIHSNQSDFTFPLDISTKDNNKYSLAAVNVDTFWQAGKDFVKAHLDSGRDLKKSIFDAIDKTAVDAIIDNR